MSVGLCRSFCWEQPAALGRAAPSPYAPPGIPNPPVRNSRPGTTRRPDSAGRCGAGGSSCCPSLRAEPTCGTPRALGCSGGPWPSGCCVLRWWWLRLCWAALLLESETLTHLLRAASCVATGRGLRGVGDSASCPLCLWSCDTLRSPKSCSKVSPGCIGGGLGLLCPRSAFGEVEIPRPPVRAAGLGAGLVPGLVSRHLPRQLPAGRQLLQAAEEQRQPRGDSQHRHAGGCGRALLLSTWDLPWGPARPLPPEPPVSGLGAGFPCPDSSQRCPPALRASVLELCQHHATLR